MLYPLFMTRLMTEQKCIRPQHHDEEHAYLTSGYWTKDETEARWYATAYFPYCTDPFNIDSIKEHIQCDQHEAVSYKIGALYALVGEACIPQKDLRTLLQNEPPLIANAIYNAESFDIPLYSIHQVLELIKDNITGQQHIVSKIQGRLNWLAELRKKRERTPLNTPDALRFCFSDGMLMTDFLTAENIAAVFTMGCAQFTALQAKLEKVKQNQRYGDGIVTIEDTTYYTICAIAPYLIPSRMLNNEFYDVKEYGKDENAKSVCRYLFGPVIKQFKDTQASQESVRTIAFSAFENKKIDRTAVIEAALNNELTIYLKHDPSALSYLDRIAYDCDLLKGDINFKASNTRIAGLARLKIDNPNEDYFLGQYNRHPCYLANPVGLCVRMLFNRTDILDNSLLHPDKHDKLKIYCDPTDEEKAYGLRPFVPLSKDQLANYLDYVVIKENEYCQEFVIPEDLRKDVKSAEKIKRQRQAFSNKGGQANKKKAEQIASPVLDAAYEIMNSSQFKFCGWSDLARKTKDKMGQSFPYKNKNIDTLRRKLPPHPDFSHLKDKK